VTKEVGTTNLADILTKLLPQAMKDFFATSLCIGDDDKGQGSLVSQVVVSVTSWVCALCGQRQSRFYEQYCNGLSAYCSRGLNKCGSTGVRACACQTSH
jgi:hypothetical protein